MTSKNTSLGELSSIQAAHSLISDRTLTPQDLFSESLRSIRTTADRYNYMMFLDEDALAKRERVRCESLDPRGVSLLDNIPILLKDNMDTDDMPTTAGSVILAQLEHPRCDAPVVSTLRSSGAIIVGKANLSEWSNFRGSNSISGWSGVGGQCRNAIDESRSPGGSSSGSAVAVALGAVRVAIGTETDGSLMCPAAFNGVVALKPTHGLISSEGVVPISKSQDTVGPIARSVLDVACAFITMSEKSRPFELLDSIKAYTKESFTDFKKPRIGIATSSLFGYHSGTDKVIFEAVEALSERVELVRDCDRGKGNALKVSNELEFEVLITEFAFGIERYMATRAVLPVRALEWLIDENKKNESLELSLFGQELFEAALSRRSDLSSLRYLQALGTNRSNSRRKLRSVFDKDKIDVILAPTMSPAPLIDHRVGDAIIGSGYSIAAVSGYPSLTLPAGYVNDLPVGILLIGKPNDEITLLSIAALIEEALSFKLKVANQ